ncbi:MAG: ribosomal protein large subunit ribosomal protein [Candidatus Parcubacteria bacterium]|jgi:large subunit ribosomal protein L10
MAITKAKKQEIVADVKNVLSKAKSVVFVNFHKLTVLETTAIRKELRSHGLGYLVAKKTLAKRALAEAGVSGELPQLDGELALVYGEDQIAPAREIFNFQKKLDNRVAILGGIFEASYKTKEEMTSIASIPSRKTLYAQFVNLINSPIQGLVLGLNAIAEKKQQ